MLSEKVEARKKNRERMRRVRCCRSLDEQTYPPMVKGRISERIAETFLRLQGHQHVTLLGGPGQPDITFIENGVIKTVEVKSAIRRSPRNNQWYVDRVSERRKSDDFMAIVLPNQEVVFGSMSEHLRVCGIYGLRNITDLVNHKCPELFIPRRSTKRAAAEIIKILTERGDWYAEL